MPNVKDKGLFWILISKLKLKTFWTEKNQRAPPPTFQVTPVYVLRNRSWLRGPYGVMGIEPRVGRMRGKMLYYCATPQPPYFVLGQAHWFWVYF